MAETYLGFLCENSYQLNYLLKKILTLNNFIFNSVNYIQKMECTTGTVSAPSYSNLVMAICENKKHIYPYNKDMSLLILRYIDYMFIIWKKAREQLITFINELNKRHNIIESEYEISLQKILFLDTIVYNDENNLQTTLYRKLIDQQSYLHAKSEHPSALKSSIAYS